MIVSRCCGDDVYIEMRDHDSWYECKKCNSHCDVRVSFLPNYDEKVLRGTLES